MLAKEHLPSIKSFLVILGNCWLKAGKIPLKIKKMDFYAETTICTYVRRLFTCRDL